MECSASANGRPCANQRPVISFLLNTKKHVNRRLRITIKTYELRKGLGACAVAHIWSNYSSQRALTGQRILALRSYLQSAQCPTVLGGLSKRNKLRIHVIWVRLGLSRWCNRGNYSGVLATCLSLPRFYHNHISVRLRWRESGSLFVSNTKAQHQPVLKDFRVLSSIRVTTWIWAIRFAKAFVWLDWLHWDKLVPIRS